MHRACSAVRTVQMRVAELHVPDMVLQAEVHVGLQVLVAWVRDFTIVAPLMSAAPTSAVTAAPAE